MFDEPDERRHDSGAADPNWVEVNSILSVSERGALWFELAVQAVSGHAQFRGALLRHDEKPLVLVGDDLVVPPSGLEFRGSGIWVELVCETPMSHWSYGLEAFALALDSPTELAHTGRGHRAALGWELEFESDGDAEPWGDGYFQSGELHGLVLTADGEETWTGPATRGHCWGLAAVERLRIAASAAAPIGWVAVPGHQPVTVGEDPGGVSVT